MKSVKLVNAGNLFHKGRRYVKGKINMVNDDLAEELLASESENGTKYFEEAKEGESEDAGNTDAKQTQAKKGPAKQTSQSKKQAPSKQTQKPSEPEKTGDDSESQGGVKV